MKMKVRRWMAGILCLLLVLCGLQIDSEKHTAKAYTSHTANEAIAWAASKVGQSLEGDNYYGPNNSCAYQCVDFIILYYKYLGVSPSTGNGCDYATNALPSGWTRVKGGQPQKGDILVYSGNKSNPAGHVAIYESDRSTYHQNFNSCGKITHETYQYNKLSNAYWGYIRPDWTTAHEPFGCVDTCESRSAGTLLVTGWAIDEDNYGAQLEIHVYVGPENNAAGYNIGAANAERPDVDNVYHCGKYHGFYKTIDVDRTGWQRIRIFAINVGGGNNQLLYDNTVYIEPAHDPIGCVDTCESRSGGTLLITGWAIDEDNYGAQLEIHAYIGPEDNAAGYNLGAANAERQDVDNVYNCGKYHGFYKTISVDRTGWQRVRIFAINVGGGNNQLLYDNTVYIESEPDSEKQDLESYDVAAEADEDEGDSLISSDSGATSNQTGTAEKADAIASSVSVKKPGKVTGLQVTNKKKNKITVSWNWEVDMSGFQIEYAQNNKFTKNKKSKLVSKWTSQKTITKLKKGKTYYVRVRAYKKSSGKKVYGKWSKVKKVKINK